MGRGESIFLPSISSFGPIFYYFFSFYIRTELGSRCPCNTLLTCWEKLSRALAEEWEATVNPARSPFKNPMQQISLFVLLDLLGAKHPQVPSYFQGTHWAYQRMATLEGRLRQLGLLESEPGENPFLYESGKLATLFSGGTYVGDDHVPFMRRGAPVLHLIPSPFPAVWHTMEDDGEHLDIPTVKDWARIVTAFTLEWMDVQKTEQQGNEEP